MERALAASIGGSVVRPVLRRWAAPLALGAAAVLAGLQVWRALAPAPLDVTASLLRTRGDEVTAVADGGSVRPGDLLNLDLRGSREVWAYVLNEDDAGHVSLLFPLSGTDARNPLPAGATHRLPGQLDGAPASWAVTSAGGRERVYVIASTERLESLEAAIADVPEAAAGVPVEVSPAELEQVARRVRGIGGVVKGTGGEPVRAATPLERVFERIRDTSDRDGPWTWRVELDNPVP